MRQLITAVLLGLLPMHLLAQSQPPNVIVIYLDDMGYGDLGITGATGYSTPHIDRMAKEGALLTHYYAPQAVCSASRMALLTGCYPNRVGITGALMPDAQIGIHAAETTIAEMLKTRGYATATFGKWHIGHHQPFLPLQHGFDEYHGIPYSNDMWPHNINRKNVHPPLPLFEGNTIIGTDPDQSQFTTVFTERTLSFITRHRQQPFFIYLAHPMPHVPLFVSDKFKGKSAQGLYGDVMMEIDWSVGSILQHLDSLGLSENTMVVFTSDNGPWLNYGNHAGNTGGLREGKGTSFEGGQRVPCIVRWKGKIPAGVVYHQMAAGMDILPTIAEVTGAALPALKIDGVSLWPVLQGQKDAHPRTTFYYYYRRNSLEAVRHGYWKLVFPHKGRSYAGQQPGKDGMPGPAPENTDMAGGLYDLRRDPGELYDVSQWHPEVVALLQKLADEAREDLGDDLTEQPGRNRREPGRIAKKD